MLMLEEWVIEAPDGSFVSIIQFLIGPAVLAVVGYYLARRMKKLETNSTLTQAHAAETRYQVKNSHDKNLRDDLDEKFDDVVSRMDTMLSRLDAMRSDVRSLDKKQTRHGLLLNEARKDIKTLFDLNNEVREELQEVDDRTHPRNPSA